MSIAAFVAFDVPGLGEAGEASDDLVGLGEGKTAEGTDGTEGIIRCDSDGLGHGTRPVLLRLGRAV